MCVMECHGTSPQVEPWSAVVRHIHLEPGSTSRVQSSLDTEADDQRVTAEYA